MKRIELKTPAGKKKRLGNGQIKKTQPQVGFRISIPLRNDSLNRKCWFEHTPARLFISYTFNQQWLDPVFFKKNLRENYKKLNHPR